MLTRGWTTSHVLVTAWWAWGAVAGHLGLRWGLHRGGTVPVSQLGHCGAAVHTHPSAPHPLCQPLCTAGGIRCTRRPARPDADLEVSKRPLGALKRFFRAGCARCYCDAALQLQVRMHARPRIHARARAHVRSFDQAFGRVPRSMPFHDADAVCACMCLITTNAQAQWPGGCCHDYALPRQPVHLRQPVRACGFLHAVSSLPSAPATTLAATLSTAAHRISRAASASASGDAWLNSA